MAFSRSFNVRNIKKLIDISKKNFHLSSCLLSGGENVQEALFIPYQCEEPKRKRKVSVIGGAGATGVAMGYTLLLQNYCDEFVLYDVPKASSKLRGEGLDFRHGVAIRNSPKVKTCLDPEGTSDSDIIIFNSGCPTTKDQSRLDVAQLNINHFAEVVPCIAGLSPNSVMIVITNPSDIMTYACWKYSGFDKNRIIGTGTELDSSRFRYHISQRLGINPHSVTGWVIGEHGDSSVPVWSSVCVAGTRLRELDPTIGTCKDKNDWNSLHKQVVKDGPMVIGMKGCTNFAIAQITDHICRAVLTNDRTIHSVSTQIRGLYGVESECFVSLPCVLGNRGVCDIVQLCLEDDEIEKLNESVCILDTHMQNMTFP